MAELDIEMLKRKFEQSWDTYLVKHGLAIIAALEDRDRLLEAARELIRRGPQSAAWEPFFDLVAEIEQAWKPPAVLEGRDD